MSMGEHPAAKLERVFGDIAATRMADVPILNSALRVEAVGFRPWEGRWIGVLVTPWMMSLMMLPGEASLLSLRLDEKQHWAFPSGEYVFMGMNEPALGVCQTCPLISPMAEFAAHDEAREVAQEIMRTLMEATVQRDEDLGRMIEEARVKGESLAHKPVSRRDFLRMPLLGR